MGFKQRVERSPIAVVLGFTLAGFAAGWVFNGLLTEERSGAYVSADELEALRARPAACPAVPTCDGVAPETVDAPRSNSDILADILSLDGELLRDPPGAQYAYAEVEDCRLVYKRFGKNELTVFLSNASFSAALDATSAANFVVRISGGDGRVIRNLDGFFRRGSNHVFSELARQEDAERILGMLNQMGQNCR